jgi:hypothetical protein
MNVKCQNQKHFLDYFPDLQNRDTVINSAYLWNMLDLKKEIDTIFTLKYFFDNKVENMHAIFEGYNADENTYTYTPYTKGVYPVYKNRENEYLYLLCYSIESVMYLAMYNIQNDVLVNTLIVADFSNERDQFIQSIMLPNDYIVTVQSIDKTYYILSKIDYESRKFIEIKKIKPSSVQSFHGIMNDAMKTLGISETGELLENNP